MTTSSNGLVQLVGAGPGDPELLTIKAQSALRRADVVIYDYLANPALLKWVRESAMLIYVGKSAGRHTIPQQEIGAKLVEHAKAGKRVVRLKGGDPFIFGRGGEEMEDLRVAGIPFEIIPGVTAALASAAYTGIPLSHRDHSSAITFLTGHENPEKHTLSVDFRAYAQTNATLCIYMGMGQLARISSELMEGGLSRETPVAVVQWASLSKQQSLVSSLGEVVSAVEACGLGAPAVIIVGEVVRFRELSSWFESRPLHGKRVVVTRAKNQASELTDQLTTLGAEVLELPFIQISPEMDHNVTAEVFADIATFEWLVFTSANGVRSFFRLLMKAFPDIRCLGPARIAAVGAATTRELGRYRLAVDVMPRTANAVALAEAMIATGSMESTRVLVITGNQNRPDLVETLESKGGAIVDTLPLYRTDRVDWVSTPSGNELQSAGADVILFTSSSTVRSYAEAIKSGFLYSESARQPVFGSIGPMTSETMEAEGMEVAFEASSQSLESFTQATVDFFKKSK